MIVDSQMSYQEAMANSPAPDEILSEQILLDVYYYSFDKRLHQGQVVIHRSLEGELIDIFDIMREIMFPLARVIPIVHYDWSDEASMVDDNTSGFNYRFIAGTARLSSHARGMAVDVNPLQNPFISADGRYFPAGSSYISGAPGVLTREGTIVKAFLERGWRWGGDFASVKDYHHFEKS